MPSMRGMRWFAVAGLAALMLSACGNSGSQPESGEAAPQETSAEPEESPDVADARLEGTWTVELETIESENLSDQPVGNTVTRVYTFSPTCSEGPCDTELERETSTEVRTEMLAFSDGVYTFASEPETHKDPSCGNKRVESLISYEIQVSAAEDVGAWRATSFVGEFEHRFMPSAQAQAAGCPKRAHYVSDMAGSLES
jgi:hypothetical protein